MPIYEYQCQECEHELEALQRVGAAPLSDCPECGKPALRKLISAPGFHPTELTVPTDRDLVLGVRLVPQPRRAPSRTVPDPVDDGRRDRILLDD